MSNTHPLSPNTYPMSETEAELNAFLPPFSQEMTGIPPEHLHNVLATLRESTERKDWLTAIHMYAVIHGGLDPEFAEYAEFDECEDIATLTYNCHPDASGRMPSAQYFHKPEDGMAFIHLHKYFSIKEKTGELPIDHAMAKSCCIRMDAVCYGPHSSIVTATPAPVSLDRPVPAGSGCTGDGGTGSKKSQAPHTSSAAGHRASGPVAARPDSARDDTKRPQAAPHGHADFVRQLARELQAPEDRLASEMFTWSDKRFCQTPAGDWLLESDEGKPICLVRSMGGIFECDIVEGALKELFPDSDVRKEVIRRLNDRNVLLMRQKEGPRCNITFPDHTRKKCFVLRLPCKNDA